MRPSKATPRRWQGHGIPAGVLAEFCGNVISLGVLRETGKYSGKRLPDAADGKQGDERQHDAQDTAGGGGVRPRSGRGVPCGADGKKAQQRRNNDELGGL